MGLFRRKKEAIRESFPVAIGSAGYADFSNTQDKALENSTFWACLTNLCRTFATLPLHHYAMTGNRREVQQTSPVAKLLKQPCPYMPAYLWKFAMAFNFETAGIAYAIIGRSATGGVPIALYPVSPSVIRPEWKAGKLVYIYTPTGEAITAEDMLVINNTRIGFTSILSPLEYAKKDIALATSAKSLQTGYYKRGTTIGGIVTVPKGTDKTVKDQIKAMFNSEYAGEHNAYKTAVIEDVIKYDPIRLSEGDSKKMEEAQSWTLLEVCRRFGVPPFFAGDLTKATYANSEQQGTQLVQYSIQPRAKSWEDSLDAALCRNGEYVKFSLGGLMRGDHAARSTFYQSAILTGWMTVNEARALEDLNPVPEGDTLMFPMNYMSLENAIKSKPVGIGYGEKQEAPAPLSEKRAKDMSFLTEVQAVTKTSRSRVESVIRAQLRAEIAELKRLVGDGLDAKTALEQFRAFCEGIAAEYGQRYLVIYRDIINRLAPIVQKQVATGVEPAADSMEAYAAKYSVSMAGRHGSSRAGEAERTLASLEGDALSGGVDSLADHWIETVPVIESADETARAGNAFNVFLYASLGVTMMHVVASGDSCEFCQKLDGKVVEVNGTILSKGDTVDDGAGNVRTISKNFKHPPFHTHCQCGVAPGR